MKRYILVLATTILCATTIQAQTTYEAANVLGSDLNGTARFVGMGGAMSALGADISTMGTNPAGIGLYRSCDMMLSFGGNSVSQKTAFKAVNNSTLRTSGSFDNTGLVIANKISNEGVLRFVNTGFNYHRVKNFNQNMLMSGNLGGLSQTGQMAMQVFDNLAIGDEFFDPESDYGFPNYNYYRDPNFGWLSLLGADSYLIDNTAFDEGFYYPSETCKYTGYENGGISDYDFNLSFNFIDQVYFGATLTYTNVNYSQHTIYSEQFSDGNYTLENWYKTLGGGVNLKVGAIIRPFEDSSLRFGIAATTPTLLHLTDYNSAIISSTINNETYCMDTYDEAAFYGDCETSYSNRTPAKINVSAGYTFGCNLALGAEYEYTNLSATRLYEEAGNENMVINEHTHAYLMPQHTFRLGAEKVFFDCFSVRAGYNYISGGYDLNAWKMIPINSVQTNTDYKNIRNTNNVTFGIGYSGEAFYADLGILCSRQNADFYPFDNTELQATKLTRTYVKGLCTLGLRF